MSRPSHLKHAERATPPAWGACASEAPGAFSEVPSSHLPSTPFNVNSTNMGRPTVETAKTTLLLETQSPSPFILFPHSGINPSRRAIIRTPRKRQKPKFPVARPLSHFAPESGFRRRKISRTCTPADNRRVSDKDQGLAFPFESFWNKQKGCENHHASANNRGERIEDERNVRQRGAASFQSHSGRADLKPGRSPTAACNLNRWTMHPRL